MMISTRGRYALRVMIDIAEQHTEGGYIAMKEVAARQEISLKYLERILPDLVKAHMIEGVHGKGGGYRLTRDPKDYKVGEILRLTEGDLAPVTCLEEGAVPCKKAAECRTLPLWSGLNKVVNEYLDSMTLADLLKY
ncbi:MAG: Rrf2 family transcriptional regulator [Clostridiales bacterium]|nr:Rrf2 family transcriptional regulator [Clostridiales bacterium]